MPRPARSAVALLLTAAALTACSSGEATEPPPSTSPTAATATPPPGARDLPPAEEAMDPGTYTFTPFRPAVTFHVVDGWEAGHEIAEFFDIWHGEHTTLGFAHPEFVVGADGPVDVADLRPGEVVSALAGNPDVTSYRLLGAVRVGDRRGPGIAFRTREGGELFGGEAGTFNTVEPAVHGQIVALDVDGEIVLVMEMSLQPPHDPHRRTIREVADTVRFP